MTNIEELSADELARACAKAMWAQDKVPKSLGMELAAIASGSATLAMKVSDDMINGHKICHGGLIFTLADTAFAYACNTYNQNTVAQHCTINFMNPAMEGERLTATATERIREGRSGIYDITVTNEYDKIIAEFRGTSRTIKGQMLS